MLYFLTAVLFLGISYLCIRYYAFVRLRRSCCPLCEHHLVRIKRTREDRLWGSILRLPIKRYQCEHYRCHWQGRSVLNIPYTEPTVEFQRTEPLSPSLLKTYKAKKSEPNPAKNTERSQKLYDSFKQNSFVLNYHPIVNITTNNIIGIEALLRWMHPEEGLLPAADFIHQIEDDKIFLLIGEWILQNALSKLRYWHNLGFKPLSLSVNLSAQQFYSPNLISALSKGFEELDLDPYFFELEVLESTILQNEESAQKILLDLQKLGIQVAIDDFDLDNLSLKELRKYAFNIIKIDQKIIHKLTLKSNEFEKIRHMMSIAADHNLTVVAEGVETREQLNLLRSLDCEMVQGYLFDYPLTAEDTTDVLQSNWLGRKSED